ncbi:MAG: hypothetical protein QOF58_4194, partial [Pseudonocardiales bacterium]|nr:hypothetical protein [Pseudonocardiales bacterium]
EVRVQPAAQALRLADVHDPATGVAELVDAGSLGNRAHSWAVRRGICHAVKTNDDVRQKLKGSGQDHLVAVHANGHSTQTSSRGPLLHSAIGRRELAAVRRTRDGAVRWLGHRRTLVRASRVVSLHLGSRDPRHDDLLATRPVDQRASTFRHIGERDQGGAGRTSGSRGSRRSRSRTRRRTASGHKATGHGERHDDSTQGRPPADRAFGVHDRVLRSGGGVRGHTTALREAVMESSVRSPMHSNLTGLDQGPNLHPKEQWQPLSTPKSQVPCGPRR